MSRGDEEADEAAEWNQDAESDGQRSEGSDDSLDQLVNEELGREGMDSDEDAFAALQGGQSDISPWLDEPPTGQPSQKALFVCTSIITSRATMKMTGAG